MENEFKVNDPVIICGSSNIHGTVAGIEGKLVVVQSATRIYYADPSALIEDRQAAYSKSFAAAADEDRARGWSTD